MARRQLRYRITVKKIFFHKNRWLLVGWIQKFEGQASEETGCKFCHQVNPDVGKMEKLHHCCADCDCWVEGAAGNRAHSEYAGQHREADSETIKTIVERTLRGCAVEDYVGERKGEEELCDEHERD